MTRREGCLSDFRFDLLMRDELDEAAAARAHIADCEACTARLAVLEESRAAFVAEMPPLPALTAVKPPTSRRRWRLAGLVAAPAFAVLAFLIFHAGVPSVRSKGSFAIGVYVKHGDGVRLADPDESVEVGDALRLFYAAPRAAWFAVVSIDPVAHASVYYPSHEELVRVEAAREKLLEDSIVLDGTVGTETLYGVFCDHDQALAPIIHAIEAGSPTGCSVARWVIHKKRP